MEETSDGKSNLPVTLDRDVSKFYVYILFSFKDRGLYIGFTSNLKKRLINHSKGLIRATKLRRPVKLIHYEYFVNIGDAKSRERFLKSGYGRDQLKQFLKRTFQDYVKYT